MGQVNQAQAAKLAAFIEYLLPTHNPFVFVDAPRGRC